MTIGVIHFISEILKGTQMIGHVINFVSEMLRGIKMTVWVINFILNMFRDTQMIVGIICFVSEMLRVSPEHFLHEINDPTCQLGASEHF